jgi:acyl dehydratase
MSDGAPPAATTGQVVTTLEQLKGLVGREIRVGPWHTVTQHEVDAFADSTGDHQWIHTDVERARQGPYGGTIAHGYWTLSAAPFILREAGGEGVEVQLPSRLALNYGVNRVRFINPVRVGKRIRARTTLLSVEEVEPDAVQQIQQITVEIEGEIKPAMVAESIVRQYLQPAE